jgi:hypothetical protein
MQTSLAATQFAEAEGHPFQYMHCWDIMKDEPKWMDMKHNKGPLPVRCKHMMVVILSCRAPTQFLMQTLPPQLVMLERGLLVMITYIAYYIDLVYRDYIYCILDRLGT